MPRENPVKAWLTNWRASEQDFLDKVRSVTRNNLIKIRTRKDCCGHWGEVGC